MSSSLGEAERHENAVSDIGGLGAETGEKVKPEAKPDAGKASEMEQPAEDCSAPQARSVSLVLGDNTLPLSSATNSNTSRAS